MGQRGKNLLILSPVQVMKGNALFTTGQIAVYSFSWPKRSDHRSDLNSSDFVN